ncbi:MAG: deoxynucleoside kinase [Anaerolineae bacterium]|nr:deoxynucleoside kinase [Anaerolineae bacterium]
MAELKKDDKLMILLEGNIGAGKTTVGKALASSDAFDFIEEPTAAWREGFAANMLDLFYSDTRRWAFTFQICAFITRAKTWKEVLAYTDHSRVVLERSVFCDRYIFAENCYRTGLMTPPEYQVYCGLWEFLVSNYCVEPDLILYLRTPAEICMDRIKVRDRMEESGIPLDYLLQLENLHDEWLLDNPRTVLLDGEQRWNAEEIRAKVDETLSR